MGVAEVDVAPDGVVRIHDALWRARTNRATPITAGDRDTSGGRRRHRARGRTARRRRARSPRARPPPEIPRTAALSGLRCCHLGAGRIRSAAIGGPRGCRHAWRSASFTRHGICAAACRGPESVAVLPADARRTARGARAARGAAPRRSARSAIVRDDCLDFALRVREPHGIWGGLTETERRRRLPATERRLGLRDARAGDPFVAAPARHAFGVEAREQRHHVLATRPQAGRARPRP